MRNFKLAISYLSENNLFWEQIAFGCLFDHRMCFLVYKDLGEEGQARRHLHTSTVQCSAVCQLRCPQEQECGMPALNVNRTFMLHFSSR